jgi:hypothetical protein
MKITISKLQDYESKLNHSILLFSILERGPPFEMRREPSYLYINENKRLIITDPLFSQPIPSNPPQISWIRYSISMIFSLK